MPQMNSLEDKNKTNDLGDRNHFSEYFDEIVESLKVHATKADAKGGRRTAFIGGAQPITSIPCLW